MSSLASTNPQSKIDLPEEEQEITVNDSSSREDDQEEAEAVKWVTTHLHLKPAHFTGTLDKEVALRRIRQRKRANKVQAPAQGFFCFPFLPAKRRTNSNQTKVSLKWVDDAFAAP